MSTAVCNAVTESNMGQLESEILAALPSNPAAAIPIATVEEALLWDQVSIHLVMRGLLYCDQNVAFIKRDGITLWYKLSKGE